MFNLSSHSRNIKNTLKFQVIPVRMVVIKKMRLWTKGNPSIPSV